MLKGKLKEIIAIVEESNVHEVEVSTWWGRKIRVTKDSSDPAKDSPNVSVHTEPQVSTDSISDDQLVKATTGVDISMPVKDTSKHQKIHAPIVGTFYRAPSPESSPYINVGDKISVGQTICIIEAMKIMNEIESDVDGTVVDILVENASPVEFNQPLVVVDPG
ncbi:MAG: acetyl-CoA carboxylase biotin carboxyl carrier protein [Fidelibacterota bacterium]|nr:MAG: acetyl-CoA carboxylase biotin carboxyl carrier protein [Candidatus Neomarinimicrobiota bacterium]